MRFGPTRRRVSPAVFSLRPLTEEFTLAKTSLSGLDQKGKDDMRRSCISLNIYDLSGDVFFRRDA
jgi:hypothetical protein